MANTHKKKSQNDWEERKLGASESFARKVSHQREQNVDDNLGLQLISIRLQKKLINQLKECADADGIGYQPYIRQVLTRHIHDMLHTRSRKKLRAANR